MTSQLPSLARRTALLTGCTSGIGQAVVAALAQAGAGEGVNVNVDAPGCIDTTNTSTLHADEVRPVRCRNAEHTTKFFAQHGNVALY